MKGKRIAAAALVAAGALFGSTAFAEGDIALFVGQKQLDENDWKPIDNLPEIGMILTTGGREWPVKMAIDLLYGENDKDVKGANRKVSTVELDGGVRRFFLKKLRPFVGGGLAIVKGVKETDVGVIGTDSDDWAPGYWVDGGFLWNVGKKLRLGVEARHSAASLSIAGKDVEGGGTHVGFLLGWGL